MKNIQYTLLRTGCRTLAALGAIAFFAIAGVFVTAFVPGPFHQMDGASPIVAVISIGLAVFVWSVFRFVKPARPNRNWQIAEFALVPIYWLLLMLAADVVLASTKGMPEIINTLAF